MFKLERVFLLCLNNHFIILLNINTFNAFFLQKIKTYYLCLILTSFLDCVIREILGSVLKPPFLCKCCSAIRREEVCKQVGCERGRLTLYINNTNFPLINMQQLKHIIFSRLTEWASYLQVCTGNLKMPLELNITEQLHTFKQLLGKFCRNFSTCIQAKRRAITNDHFIIEGVSI